MAPNPITVPRKPVPRRSQAAADNQRNGGTRWTPVIATAAVAVLVANLAWARNWLLSGAAIETLLILYGADNKNRIFPAIPLWTLIATLNLIYAVASTSWLLFWVFTGICYVSALLTSLSQFRIAANIARKVLRRTLGNHPHFVKDKIALFNLPALELDTDVDGLFVIRGVTISFASLTIVAHGIELGIKLADEIELAIYVDEVNVSLFRRIDIGDIYANVKGGKFEMTFAEIDATDDDAASEDGVFLDSTPLLRAATAGSTGFKDRPKLRETLTGVSYMRDSSARAGLDIVTKLSPDDEIADKQYNEKLTEIRTSSAVYQSRQQVRQKRKAANAPIDDEKDMRAAVSAELHNVPSIPHPPERSVRVTTLQNLSPPYVRRFMHRLPFLLRLLLAPLSYFHPIGISSITAAGSGQWLSVLLQQNVFKGYTESNAELRRLHRRVSQWLADANFCLQLTDIDGLGQVALSTAFDINAYLRFADVMAYRTVPQSGKIEQVVRLGGADATFTIPSFLLPHHEHLVPPKPTLEDEEDLESRVEHADGQPKTMQAERELEQAQKDETNITMSVHGSLPASCDQSLLNFVAALVKATKIIELEKEVDEVDPSTLSSEPNSPVSPTFEDSVSVRSHKSSLSIEKVANFKAMAKNIRQNLKDGTTGASIREFARDLHQNTKDGVKKAMVGGLVNDRWIAKIVGKTAAMLQKAQGDIGYSGQIPVPLESYRAAQGLESKLLP